MSKTPNIQLVNITLLNFLARIFFFAFVFVAGYLTSRGVSKNDFGQLQYISLLASLGWLFFNFGFPTVMSRNIAQQYAKGNIYAVWQFIKRGLFVFCFSLAASLFALFLIHENVSTTLPLWLILFFAISQWIVSFLQLIVQSIFQYKGILIINVVACLVGVLSLFFLLPSLGILAYLISFSVVYGILIIGFVGIIISHLNSFSQTKNQPIIFENSKWVKQSFHFAASAILAGVLWQRYELYILKMEFGFEQVAVYGIAFSTIAFFTEPLKMIPSVLVNYFASLQQPNAPSSKKYFYEYYKHFAWLVLFLGCFLWFNLDTILLFLYTDNYADSIPIAKILLLGFIPAICSYVVMNVLVGLGKSTFLFWQDLAMAICMIVSFYIGLFYFQVAGVAYAKTSIMLLSVGVGMLYTYFRLQYNFPLWSITKSCMLSVLIIYPMCWFGNNHMLWLMCKAVVSFSVYVVASYYTGCIDKSFVTKLWKRIWS